VAAAWLSPPSPLAFSLSGGVFGAFPHRTILCAWNRVLNPFLWRDGPPELLCLLWPPSIRVRSAGGVAQRGLPRTLVHRSIGVPPRAHPPSPATDRARARPSVAGFSPAQVAKPESRSPSRAIGHCCRAGRRVAPMPDEVAVGPLRIAAPPPVGLHRYIPGSCRNRCCAEPPPLARSLGAWTDLSRAHPLPGSCPPFGESVPPDPLVPPAWFDPHLGGLRCALVSRLLHLVPVLTSLRFHSALPPTATGCPVAPGVGDATFSRSVVSHPSKNPPPVCLRTRDANLGPAAPRHRGRCPLAVFTTSRLYSGPRGQRIANRRCRRS